MEPWELLGLDEGESRPDVIQAAFRERLSACGPDEVRALYDARDALLPVAEQSFDDWFKDPGYQPESHEGHYHVPPSDPITEVEPLPPVPPPRPPPPKTPPPPPPPPEPKPRDKPKPAPKRKQPKRTWRSGRKQRTQTEKETSGLKAAAMAVGLIFTFAGLVSKCSEKPDPYDSYDPVKLQNRLKKLREENKLPDWNNPEEVKRWREKVNRRRNR